MRSGTAARLSELLLELWLQRPRHHLDALPSQAAAAALHTVLAMMGRATLMPVVVALAQCEAAQLLGVSQVCAPPCPLCGSDEESLLAAYWTSNRMPRHQALCTAD